MFKVKWGDIAKEYSHKVMVANPGESTPLKFYFEDETKLLLFLHARGVTRYAEVLKSRVKVNDFKFEYTQDAYELQENPLQSYNNKVSIVVKQE